MLFLDGSETRVRAARIYLSRSRHSSFVRPCGGHACLARGEYWCTEIPFSASTSRVSIFTAVSGNHMPLPERRLKRCSKSAMPHFTWVLCRDGLDSGKIMWFVSLRHRRSMPTEFMRLDWSASRSAPYTRGAFVSSQESNVGPKLKLMCP